MKKFALFVLSILMLLSVNPVFAQDSEPANEAEVQEETLEGADADEAAERFTKDSQREKIKELQNLYTLQIESYRVAEKEYRIAKEQYQKLQTLKLLEDAVKASTKAMTARNTVLTTYFDLLYFSLLDSTGVQIDYKEANLQELEERITELRDFGTKLEETNNRDMLLERATEFELMEPKIESTAHRTLSLLAIGKLQTIHDKGLIILTDLKAAEKDASSSALKAAQLDRAFTETERNLDAINASLRETNDLYARQEGLIQKSLYDRIIKELSPVFVDLSQVVSYLLELLRV